MKTGFDCNPPLTPLLDGENWQLHEPMSYTANDGTTIFIPAGFVTDFASVPRLFWNILPPTGVYDRAAILHDFLYRGQVFPRARCDALLNEAMVSLGVSWWIRWLIYGNVRMFGWMAYNNEPIADKVP
jgi:hypothetical protein